MVRVGAAVWLLAFLVAVGAASALSVPGNVTLNITDSSGLLEYPGGSQSFNAAENVTGWWGFSIEVPSLNATANLTSNETREVSGCFDKLSLSCEASATCSPQVVNQTIVYVNGTAVNVSVCTIDATLGDGETYSRNDSYCNVKVHFGNQSYLAQTYNGSVNITKFITIAKNGNAFSVSLDNTTQSVDMSFVNASTQLPVKYVCPLTIQNLSTETDALGMWDVCNNYMPYFLDWLNSTMHGCINGAQAYRDFVNAHYKEVSDSNQQLSDCRALTGVKDGELNVCNARTVEMQKELDDRDGRLDMLIGLSWMEFVIIIALVVCCAILLHRASAEG